MKKRSDLTVVYYTSNREEESFEKRVRQKLLQAIGDLPLISVSQKPINFGKNICVGIHTPNNANLFRQLLIGCKAAKTPFVANAEADFLYPPEYFSFKPKDREKIYCYSNIGVMYKYHWGVFPKEFSEGAQIAGREYLILVLENRLKSLPKWVESNNDHFRHLDPYLDMPRHFFSGKNACVTFKTGSSLHKYFATESHSVPSLPYWGTAADLRKEMFG